MSGELVVVGASGVREIAARAGLLSADFTAARALLAGPEWLPANAWLSASGVGFAAAAAHAEVAYFGAAPLEGQLASLSSRILVAAERYERSEVLTRAVVEAVGASVANALGRSVPLTVALLGPAAGAAALVALAGESPTLSDPRIQSLIRVAVEGADEFALGLLGLPPAPNGDANALVTVALAGLGVVGLVPSDRFRVTGSATPITGRAEQVPPRGLGELVAAIPVSVDGGPQVRVTRYRADDGRLLSEVAIAGTSNQAYGSTANPFDLAGNLAAYAGVESQSVSAVLAAMERAGIEPGDAVVFAGYSQGALVAAAIAGLGRYETRGLVSIGGPIDAPELRSQLPERGDARPPIIEIQHREDPIVGLQGAAPDGSHSTVVLADAGARVPFSEDPLSAHAQDRYLETARAADLGAGAALATDRERLLSLYEGMHLEASNVYTVHRLDPLPAPREALDEISEAIEERFSPITSTVHAGRARP